MEADCDYWHLREAHVTADMAIANLMKNAERTQIIAVATIRIVGAKKPASIAHTALSNSLVTQPNSMSADTYERLKSILSLE